jgi:hypothetical protein
LLPNRYENFFGPFRLGDLIGQALAWIVSSQLFTETREKSLLEVLAEPWSCSKIFG